MTISPSTDAVHRRAAAIRALLHDNKDDEARPLIDELCRDHPERPAGFVLRAQSAVRKADWSAALDWWNFCIATFPNPDFRWSIEKAHALMFLGQLREAEVIFADVRQAHPNLPGPAVGWATCASRLKDWAAAAERWANCIDCFPNDVQPGWLISRAQALLALGKTGEARDAFRRVLERFPEERFAQWSYVRLLSRLNQNDKALFELEYGILKGRANPGLLVEKLRVHNWRTDTEGGRACFAEALHVAENVDNLTGLFDAVPETFDGWQRTDAWLRIEARLSALTMEKPQQKDAAAFALALRIMIAKRDYDGFIDMLRAEPPLPSAWEWKFKRLAAFLRAARFPDLSAPKIFVIGLTKTGTTSISKALETLGYLTAHYRNAFTNAMIADDDLFIFEALSDTPICRQFESLYFTFPNARFIHTKRPYDDWLRSFNRHYERWHGTADFDVLKRASTTRNSYLHGADFAKVHGSLYYHHPDPRTAYDSYMERVSSFFRDKPASKLLNYDIFSGDGWADLCAFLEQPVPNTPYPWENRAN
jgi:tetratricopeptide (TPR) repeat protein